MNAERRGLSLVEVLMALCVVSVVFSGLFQGLHTGYQGTERLSEESYAQNHAVSLLEALSLVPYSKLPPMAAGTAETEVRTALAAVSEFRFPGDPDPAVPRTVEVAEVAKRGEGPSDPAASAYGSLKLVRVEVSWRPRYLNADAPDRRLVFQTLVTDDMEVSRR